MRKAFFLHYVSSIAREVQGVRTIPSETIGEVTPEDLKPRPTCPIGLAPLLDLFFTFSPGVFGVCVSAPKVAPPCPLRWHPHALCLPPEVLEGQGGHMRPPQSSKSRKSSLPEVTIFSSRGSSESQGNCVQLPSTQKAFWEPENITSGFWPKQEVMFLAFQKASEGLLRGGAHAWLP